MPRVGKAHHAPTGGAPERSAVRAHRATDTCVSEQGGEAVQHGPRCSDPND